MPEPERWNDEVIIDCLQAVLQDVETYRERHFGAVPLRDETISKVQAALRLIEREKL